MITLIFSLFVCPQTTFSEDLTKKAIAQQQSMRLLTVSDVVGMTVLVDPDVKIATLSGATAEFKYSPNGRYFTIVTRSGNVNNGENEYELILYDIEAVLRFVNDEDVRTTLLPKLEGELLWRFSTSSNHAPFQQLKWLPDNRTLLFIGGDDRRDTDDKAAEHQPQQLHAIDIHTKELRQLTHHARPVISFDIDFETGVLVFAARTPVFHEGRGKTHYVAGINSTIDEGSNIDAELPFQRQHQYYTAKLGQLLGAKPLGHPFFQVYQLGLWLSPNSHWAIGVKSVHQTRTDWMENYFPISNDAYKKSKIESFDEYTTGDRYSSNYYQYLLINLRDGSVEPVFDAPAGSPYGGYFLDVQWRKDSESAILSNTFLPLDGVDGTERERRRQSPATVEFNFATGEITRIMDHVVPEGSSRAVEVFTGMAMATDGELTIRRWTGGRQHGNSLPPKSFEKRNGRWAEKNSRREVGKDTERDRLELSIRQSLNSAPDIVALDRQTGREKRITDLNPQLRQLRLGETVPFDWIDKAGNRWDGAVLYPPTFRAGIRYPLVIQTHGFFKHEFLIEGPSSGPYAAQALANRDIIVLQMPDRSVGEPNQREVNRVGIEAAVDFLHKNGLIDRNKVGLIGFSGTGHIVQHVITFSDYEFAAATIADAFVIGRSGYSAAYGSSVGVSWIERLMGGTVPWGPRLREWVKRDPALHLDRVKTPLRLEQYSTAPKWWWDIYVIMRRQQKPVEFVVVPNARHSLVKPMERLAIQQENVDWFDYWLNGRERTEPYPGAPETKESLQEQYARWRKLRELQEKSEPAAEAARRWHREEAARREAADGWLQTEEGKQTIEALLESANDSDAAAGRNGTND